MNTLHKILDLMWSKGISEADLCKAAGINKSAVTDWKKGKTKSYLKHLSKIAEVLNVSESYLLDDSKTNDLEDQLSDVQFAFYGEVKDLTDKELEKLMEVVKFIKAQRKDEK